MRIIQNPITMVKKGFCSDNLTNNRRLFHCDNRDFKIGHYGRLGRLDAYTGGLGP